MYKPALLAAALSATVVYGDFIVITETNIPTVPTPSFANEADVRYFISMITSLAKISEGQELCVAHLRS